MNITPKLRWQIRLQSSTFVILLLIIIGLLAWLSTRYTYQADWTLGNRHTLSEASQRLLDQMPDPVTITAYVTQHSATDEELRESISDSISRYQRYRPDLNLRFVDPDTVPTEIRENGIRTNGELLLRYQGRTEHLLQQQFSEAELTTVLNRLARAQKHTIAFLDGHGEHSPLRFADYDLSEWARRLTERGIEIKVLDFAKTPQLTNDNKLLVIADPQSKLLPAEVTQVINYVDKGGNLLWLLEPETSLQGLEPLAEKFGLTVLAGVIMDPSSQLFNMGLARPDLVSITSDGYGEHPITENLYLRTLLPRAAALKMDSPAGWEVTPLLMTHPQVQLSQSSAQPTPEKINENAEVTEKTEEAVDTSEPLTVAVTLTRLVENLNQENEATSREQRIILVGESDFLTNAYLGLEDNIDLGIRMVDWLIQEDVFLDIPARVPTDRHLELSNTALFFLTIFFLIILPLSLISTGLLTWIQRTRT